MSTEIRFEPDPWSPSTRLPASATGGTIGGLTDTELRATALETTDSGPTNPTLVSQYSSAAAEASAVIKASAGNLYGVVGINGNVNVRYIQVFDAASLPADGTIPLFSLRAPGQGNFSLGFPEQLTSWRFAIGCVVANSSTLMSLTVGTADTLFQAQYT